MTSKFFKIFTIGSGVLTLGLVSVFLIQTGTGHTEIAEATSEQLNKQSIIQNVSEVDLQSGIVSAETAAPPARTEETSSKSKSSTVGANKSSAQSQNVSDNTVSGADYTINVTGSCINNRSCIQSSVDSKTFAYIKYPSGTLTEVAGHNTGKAVIIQKFRVGTTVKVTGVIEGTYRITSLVYTTKDSTTTDVPAGFAFQTCLTGNNMVLAYAEKIS